MEVRYGYVPTYDALDYVVPQDATEVVIYCDVKNGLYPMYYEQAILSALKQLKETGSINCGVINGLLNVVSFHKKWNKARRNGRHTIKVVFFYESGKSLYHTGLNKDYKSGRGISDYTNKLVTAEDMEDFGKLMRSNLEIFDKIANAIPDVYCVYLKYADADYIPYYLTHHVGLAKNPQSFHIIYSTDKDMGQTLKSNVVQYIRRKVQKDKVVDGVVTQKAGEIEHIYLNDNDCNHFFWKMTGNNNFDVESSAMYLSLLGDGSDGIKGVDGIGGVAAENVFTLLWEHGHRKLSNPEIFFTALDSVIEKISGNNKLIAENKELLEKEKAKELAELEKLSESTDDKEILKVKKTYTASKKVYNDKIKELRAEDKLNNVNNNSLINKLLLIQRNKEVVELAWKQISFPEIIRKMDVSHKDRIQRVIDKQYVDEISNLKDLNLLINRTLSLNLYDK